MEKSFSFPRLAERRRQPAGLSGGEQQMLAIARAMMSRPKLLLWTNPLWDLPSTCREVFDLIQEMRSEGTTILLVEQNARMALSIADRAYVLETGRLSMRSSQRMLHDERIRELIWALDRFLTESEQK